MVYLRISTRGMEALQFLTLPDGEKTVQFVGDEIHLGTVVTNNGVIGGYRDKPMLVDARRVRIHY